MCGSVAPKVTCRSKVAIRAGDLPPGLTVTGSAFGAAAAGWGASGDDEASLGFILPRQRGIARQRGSRAACRTPSAVDVGTADSGVRRDRRHVGDDSYSSILRIRDRSRIHSSM